MSFPWHQNLTYIIFVSRHNDVAFIFIWILFSWNKTVCHLICFVFYLKGLHHIFAIWCTGYMRTNMYIQWSFLFHSHIQYFFNIVIAILLHGNISIQSKQCAILLHHIQSCECETHVFFLIAQISKRTIVFCYNS